MGIKKQDLPDDHQTGLTFILKTQHPIQYAQMLYSNNR